MKNKLTILIGLVFVLIGANYALGGYTETQVGETPVQNEWRRYEFFASSTSVTTIATTTNATSSVTTYTDSSGRRDNGELLLKGAKAVSFFFTRNGDSSSVATSTFQVQVSPDGTAWVDYNKLIANVTNTNAEELTRVSSVEIVGATSTSMVSMDLVYDAPFSVRCISSFASTTIETTDSNECEATVTY